MARTEIKPEFMGISAINSFIAGVSSPRGVMDVSHFSGRHALLKPDERIIKSGIEYELGKTINHPIAPEDCVVKAIIPRYREFTETPPEVTLFVEYEKNNKIWIDVIHVPAYNSTQGYFGYHQRYTDELKNLDYNSPLPKDTILAKADSYGEDGDYRFGLTANVAYVSHPSTADDGFGVSESFAKRAAFLSVNKRVINITKNTIPLNINGTADKFKFIPNIGEMLRPDGLLCAIRERNDFFSISDLSTRSLCEFDPTFDKGTYTNTNSFVLDVKVIRGNYMKPEFSSKMTEQLDDMAAAYINYCRSVQQQYDRIIAEKKALFGSMDSVRVTGRATRHAANCAIMVRHADSGKHKLCYRKLPIDQYRIEVVTASVVIPTFGHKLTDTHAAKGVACSIIPDAMMPRDIHGNVADVLADPGSTIARTIPARTYEHFLGAVSRDNMQKINSTMINQYGPNYLGVMTEPQLESLRQFVHGLYAMINPESGEFIANLPVLEFRDFVQECRDFGFFKFFYPPDNQYNVTDVISNLKDSIYAPLCSKLSFINHHGVQETTKEDIIMGVVYFMWLEKVGNTYSAVSSAKVNNFWFPVKSTTLDKFQYPHSLTPARLPGETEKRIMASFMEPEAPADIQDLAMNPTSHRTRYRAMLESDKAYDTTYNINRDEIPYGQTSSQQVLLHITTAAGFVFEYQEDKPQ